MRASLADERPDVIVIGAGMAGVTAARALVQSGLRVAILEARDRLGGRIYTLRDFCAAPVEAGAEFIHGVGAKTWADVRAAGLRVRPNSHQRGAMMNLGDGSRWLPLAVLYPDVWPAFGILRRLARFDPTRGDLSAAQFIEHQGYRGRARILADMVFTSHLPGEPEDIGVQGLIADGALALETGRDFRIDAGYDRLVEFIARDLQVVFGAVVDVVAWSDRGVRVRTRNGQTEEAPAAIITLPAGVLQAGAVRFEPPLPPDKRAALAGVIMGPVLKLLLRFEEPFWPRRFSALYCGVGPVTLYWNVFHGVRDRPPVLCAYCTGPRAAALASLTEHEAVECVLADLRANFPRNRPRLAAWRRVDWAADPFAGGGYSFVRPHAADARHRLAAPSTGRLFWAGSETATEPIAATVEGAFTSGVRAAAEVAQALAPR